MRVLGGFGTLMILGFVFLDAFALMAVAVFIAGATLASISPVSLALQGVVTTPRDYSRSNSAYNTFYAAGMLLGPWISSLIYAARGGDHDALPPRRAVGRLRPLHGDLLPRRPRFGRSPAPRHRRVALALSPLSRGPL